MKNFKYFLIVGIIIFTSAFYFGFNNSVNSGTLSIVSGNAWNADDSGNPINPFNGMGWLSFDVSNYGVNIDNSTGYINGYAWAGGSADSDGDGVIDSPGFGWVKFGGLSGFPSGYGTTSDNAKFDKNSGKITGWARVCSAADNPSSCLGFTSNFSNGGWDGWISLSGNSFNGYTYGLKVDKKTGKFLDTTTCPTCYAWGGQKDNIGVLGWIDFSGVSTTPISSATLTLRANNDQGSTEVVVGSTITLASVGTSLNISNGTATGDWKGNKTCPVSQISQTNYDTFTITKEGTTNYTLTCDKADGSGTISSSVSVIATKNLPTKCAINPKDPGCIVTTKTPHYIEN